MKFKLRVLNGPLKGRFTPIKAGTIIGRGPKNLNLRDSKISGSHAEFVENKAGQMILQDLGSRNGIKVDGRRVKQLILQAGIQFQVGQTMVQIEELTPKRNPRPVQDLPALPPEAEMDEPESVDIEVPPSEWPEYFEDFVSETRNRIKDTPIELIPLPKMLQLKFLRGQQIDSVWSMGYGPRTIGRESLDFPLYEDNVPDLAFRILSHKAEIRIETPHSELVQLNEKYISSEELNDGDLISIGSSLIQVTIIEA